MMSKAELIEVFFKKNGIKNFDAYPFNLPFFKTTDKIEFHPEVTFIVGENGTGKSSLVEAIAVLCGFNAEGGTRNFNFSTRASHSKLHQYMQASRGVNRRKDGFFLRSESFYNVASEIDKRDEETDEDFNSGFGAKISSIPKIIDSYGGKSLHAQSHGESFWAVFFNRFGGNGLYILDEPEAALSPTRQMAMLLRINELVKQNSQFIIATHSPILIAYPNAVIYELSEDGIRVKTYRETELFQVYKDFLTNTDDLMNFLLKQ
ncbi:MAG: AAA family ATPase [Sphingobacteriaceae bacterium]|nr:MAG: AAA family ATPase [Sphingobacteriaceae bacterium]